MKNQTAFTINAIILVLFVTLFSVSNVSAQVAKTSAVRPPANPDEWVGEYHYAYSEKGGSGYVDVTDYTLTISRQANSLGCHFVATGPQLNNADYQCRVVIKGNTLTFIFVKDLSGTNDSAEYLRPGNVIGALIKVTVRGQTRYRLDNSGVYVIAMLSIPTRPKYFTKKN